jgi:hypothetical protein
MTLLKSTRILLAAIASVALIAGCSQKDGGQATPQSGAGTATSGTSAAPNEPQVGLSKFASDPCALLKADQLTSLGSFKAPRKDASSVGQRCTWSAQDVIKGAAYSVVVKTNTDTFEQVAENSKGVPVYKRTTVASYPAVSSDQTTGKGNCTTAVGVSSKEVFYAQISIENTAAPEYQDSCAATEKVAALVVQNLKG